jgi:hypothetical protein
MKPLVPFMTAVTILLATSCQKEIEDPLFTENSNPNPTTGNTAGNYQPTTKNSYWKYKITSNYEPERTSMYTATATKQTIGTIPYDVFTNSPAASGFENTYLGQKNHNHFNLVKGASPNTGALVDIALLYLNDTASVGYKWDYDAGQANGIAAKTLGVVLEKNISLTIEGKTFKNVIHTQVELQYEVPGFGFMTFITYDNYIAKDIGIIRIDALSDAMMGGVHSTSDLIEYSIK